MSWALALFILSERSNLDHGLVEAYIGLAGPRHTSQTDFLKKEKKTDWLDGQPTNFLSSFRPILLQPIVYLCRAQRPRPILCHTLVQASWVSQRACLIIIVYLLVIINYCTQNAHPLALLMMSPFGLVRLLRIEIAWELFWAGMSGLRGPLICGWPCESTAYGRFPDRAIFPFLEKDWPRRPFPILESSEPTSTAEWAFYKKEVSFWIFWQIQKIQIKKLQKINE